MQKAARFIALLILTAHEVIALVAGEQEVGCGSVEVCRSLLAMGTGRLRLRNRQSIGATSMMMRPNGYVAAEARRPAWPTSVEMGRQVRRETPTASREYR